MTLRRLRSGGLLLSCLLGLGGALVAGLRAQQAHGDGVGDAGLLESIGLLEHLDGVGGGWAVRQSDPLAREVAEGRKVALNSLGAGIVVASLGEDADRAGDLVDVAGGDPGGLAAVVDGGPALDVLANDEETVAGVDETVTLVRGATSRTNVEVGTGLRELGGVRGGALGLLGRRLLGLLGGSLLRMGPRGTGGGGVGLLGDGAHDGESGRSGQSDGALESRPGVGRGVGHVMFLPSVAAGSEAR